MCKRNEAFIGNIVSWDDKTILMSDMGVEDAVLREIQWTDGKGYGMELHCSRDTNKWYRRA